MSARRRDMIAGLIIFAIGLITTIALIPLGIVEPRKVIVAVRHPVDQLEQDRLRLFEVSLLSQRLAEQPSSACV